jgi:hypothetical protein
MASASIQVADAIVDTLNSHNFGIPFEAERNYADWDEVLQSVGFRVDVMPAGYKSAELLNRAEIKYGCLAYIVVRNKFGDEDKLDDNKIDPDKIDEMVELCEAIHEWLAPNQSQGRNGHLPSFPDAAWDETVVTTEFDRKHLRESGQFTGVLRVGYFVSVG